MLLFGAEDGGRVGPFEAALLVLLLVLVLLWAGCSALSFVAGGVAGLLLLEIFGPRGGPATPRERDSDEDADEPRQEPRQEPRREPRRDSRRAPRRAPRQPAGQANYVGAFDPSEYDSYAQMGHADGEERDSVPLGNPSDSARTLAEPGADACNDDEANDDELDGDERNANQALARNDATRVTAGAMNRLRNIKPYLEEEVAEEEGREWWGAHER